MLQNCLEHLLFDIITTNPPYMIGQHGLQNGNEAKTIARHEILCDLEDILRGGQQTAQRAWKILYGASSVPVGGNPE